MIAALNQLSANSSVKIKHSGRIDPPTALDSLRAVGAVSSISPARALLIVVSVTPDTLDNLRADPTLFIAARMALFRDCFIVKNILKFNVIILMLYISHNLSIFIALNKL